MALKITPLTVVVGQKQDLELAQGEDRQFDIAFQEPAGTPKDLTGAQAIVLTARSRANQSLVFARSYAGFASGSTGGVASFVLSQTDTISQPVGPYDISAYWKDASGYQEQLLAASTLRIDKESGAPTDTITSPIPPPLVLLGVFMHKATFSGPSGSAQTTVAWSNLGVKVYVLCSSPVTDSQEQITCQVVATSVSATGCIVQANIPFTGYAILTRVPQGVVT